MPCQERFLSEGNGENRVEIMRNVDFSETHFPFHLQPSVSGIQERNIRIYNLREFSSSDIKKEIMPATM
ncbi:4143_t:CDS:2 [Funneliformis mosseae]|uniref:4143_t:CDS:1 n=1 Tax=Funneliformis mosseae TaxID=27381 RepID=A0A9N8UYF5_FUNMO|nr:4143_t:CDS:2 [Funneliformis mosseae]